ncbi:VanZ family protein [Antarcticibacterium sp. 1MA-6-2]|uniref:VanZ family protein n=1 Tax=Antarcticibacterium sp. 1MA-6-2 TaxID=2908210 RepID=UPI001F359DD5|nr:VanZ family protein [Antarcticibacterium sp. 1MA-6-2]UJH90866.1 VanZ family protein [Antarcticibacterium sp. 1MA-6-2]
MKSEQHYKRGFLKLAGIIVLFGMFIEVLQGTLTDYRQPDWADILANTIGVLMAWLLFLIFQKYLVRVKHQITSFL